MNHQAIALHRSIRRYFVAALAGIGALVLGLGGWAATTDIAGAVIASGVVVVESSVKKVQHPTGGVVGQLNVREGDHVNAGQVLLRLDETQTRANLAVLTRTLDELTARRARLDAERDAAPAVHFPEDLVRRRANPDVGRAISEEQSLFELRRTARGGQASQLRLRIDQLRDQITGFDRQLRAKDREVNLIEQELGGIRELSQKGLVPLTRVTAVERDAARIEGEAGALMANIAQLHGKVTETELQILQVEQDMRAEVAKELGDIRGKASELEEKKVAAEDQLNRIDIRAPQNGIVHQLAMHTIGGVVTPGEPVMLIVPDADELVVDAKVDPQKIDQVRAGQRANLRFPAFSQRSTPEITGEVSRVAADLAQDQKGGPAYYLVRLRMAPEELARLAEHKLVPGMPVEAYIATADRSVLSYLLKPLSDQVRRAFRET